MARLRPYHDAIATIACLGMFWTLGPAGGTAIGDFTPVDVVAAAAWLIAGPLSLLLLLSRWSPPARQTRRD